MEDNKFVAWVKENKLIVGAAVVAFFVFLAVVSG